MKICSKCKAYKDFNSFHKSSTSKDGLKSSCKECRNIENRNRRKDELYKAKECKYREINKEKIKNYKSSYYLNNKEEIAKNGKIYYENNKEYINDRNRKYYLENKQNIEIYQKEYYVNNKESLNEYKKKWFNEKYNNDEIFRLKSSISSLIRSSFRKKSYTKESKSVELLGCSIEEFKLYLESKFEDWMNWDNYGRYDGSPKSGWDIDHNIPISSAENKEDLEKLNHYSNLQPLCSYINRNIKKDKINYEMAQEISFI